MTVDLREVIKTGETVRLLPIVSESSREKRAASALLATIALVPELRRELLSTVGVRVGARTRVEAFTEVVFGGDKKALECRPDGLLVVETGRTTWYALIEAKIGNAVLDDEQIRRYAELARDFGVDAIISVSNQFVARADQHPVALQKSLRNKVRLFHWSWTFIQTQAYLLDMEGEVLDPTQAAVLHEFVRFLAHASTGVVRYHSMNKEWRDVLRTVQTGGKLAKGSDEVKNTIGGWHQETRDLCLLMSRIVGRPTRLKLSRSHRDNALERLQNDCDQLVNHKVLCCTIEIPDAASDIQVVADLQKRTISCSMDLRAPEDKSRALSRVNWVVRQLAKSDESDIYVKAKWPGRAIDTQEQLGKLRCDPYILIGINAKSVPRSFEILMVKDLAGKFSGSRTFIEILEAMVPEYYEQIGQHIKQWQPSPPKPRNIEQEDGEKSDEKGAEKTATSEDVTSEKV